MGRLFDQTAVNLPIASHEQLRALYCIAKLPAHVLKDAIAGQVSFDGKPVTYHDAAEILQTVAHTLAPVVDCLEPTVRDVVEDVWHLYLPEDCLDLPERVHCGTEIIKLTWMADRLIEILPDADPWAIAQIRCEVGSQAAVILNG
jgi:hypothetical protein